MWIAWICCLYCLMIVQFVIAIRLLLGGCMYLWFAMALCKYVLTNTLTDCYMVFLRSFLRTNDWIINTSLLISVTVDVACATAFMQRSGCPSVSLSRSLSVPSIGSSMRLVCCWAPCSCHLSINICCRRPFSAANADNPYRSLPPYPTFRLHGAIISYQ